MPLLPQQERPSGLSQARPLALKEEIHNFFLIKSRFYVIFLQFLGGIFRPKKFKVFYVFSLPTVFWSFLGLFVFMVFMGFYVFFVSLFQGPYTQEDGYLGYFEVCKWDWKINSDIQSAVGLKNDWQGNKWIGFETVESAEVKLRYMLEMGLSGTMWWAMDLDDYSGQSSKKL